MIYLNSVILFVLGLKYKSGFIRGKEETIIFTSYNDLEYLKSTIDFSSFSFKYMTRQFLIYSYQKLFLLRSYGSIINWTDD